MDARTARTILQRDQQQADSKNKIKRKFKVTNDKNKQK